jgi:serine/threonine protein kinase
LDATTNRKILREVAMLSRVQSRNVVRYYNAWIEGGGKIHGDKKKKKKKKKKKNTNQQANSKHDNSNSNSNRQQQHQNAHPNAQHSIAAFGLHSDSIFGGSNHTVFDNTSKEYDDSHDEETGNSLSASNTNEHSDLTPGLSVLGPNWMHPAGQLPTPLHDIMADAIQEPDVAADAAASILDSPDGTTMSSMYGTNDSTESGIDWAVEPDLECNVCGKSYADWDVAFGDWQLLDVVMQPLNLCEECYIKALGQIGIHASHVQIRTKMKRPLYLFIQMEYCGRTLRDELVDIHSSSDLHDATTAHRIWNMIAQLVNGLSHMHHEQQMCHRDLKPSNIFVMPGGTVKIGDLGLATHIMAIGEDVLDDVKDINRNQFAHDEHQRALSSRDETPQAPTTGVGTFLYTAPEVLDGKYYDNKCDMYSLGIVIFEAFYPMQTAMERYCCLQDIRATGKVPVDFTVKFPAQAALVELLVNAEPQERPSASWVLQVLSAILSQLEQGTNPTALPSIAPPSDSRSSSGTSTAGSESNYGSISDSKLNAAPRTKMASSHPPTLSPPVSASYNHNMQLRLREQTAIIYELRQELDRRDREIHELRKQLEMSQSSE